MIEKIRIKYFIINVVIYQDQTLLNSYNPRKNHMKQGSKNRKHISQVRFQKQQILKTVAELMKFNCTSKKQKLNLIQEDQQFTKNFLLIIGFAMHAQLISIVPDCRSELKQQLKKLITRIDSRHVQSDENISTYSTYDQQDQMFIVLTGQVSLRFVSEDSIKINDSSQLKNSRKKSSKELIQTKIINMETQIIPYFINGQSATKILTLSQVELLQFPKRAYDSFALWILNKVSQVNINFLIQTLQLESDDIKSYKLHRKPLLRIYKGQKLNLSKKNYGVLILRTGQLKIEFQSCPKNKNDEDAEDMLKKPQQQLMQIVRSKNSDILINPGSIVHCLYPLDLKLIFVDKNNIKEIYVTKDSTLINIDIPTLDEMFQFMPKFKQTLKNILQGIAQKRAKCIAKSASEAKHISYDDSLRQMIFKNKKSFQTCKNVKQRFNKRRIQHNTADQCVNFVSNYPFTKFIQSKQRIFNEMTQNKQRRKGLVKAIDYLKITQQKKKEKMQKMLKLKLKNIAQRQISGSDQQFILNKDHIRKNIFQETEENEKEQECESVNQATLALNDTGIIHAFVKGSYSYQRKLRELIKNSQQNDSLIRGQRKTNPKSSQNHKNNTGTLQKVMNRCSLGYEGFSEEFFHKILQFQQNKNQQPRSKFHKKSQSQQDLKSSQYRMLNSPFSINGYNGCAIQSQYSLKHQKAEVKRSFKKDNKIFRKGSSGKVRMFKCQSNKHRNNKQNQDQKMVPLKKAHYRLNTLQSQSSKIQTIRV